jgi:hypothetical protein
MDEMRAVVVHGPVQGIPGLEKRDEAVPGLRPFDKTDDLAYFGFFQSSFGKEDAAEAIHTEVNACLSSFLGRLDFVDLNES